LQHGPHGPIEDQNAFLEGAQERPLPLACHLAACKLCMNTSQDSRRSPDFGTAPAAVNNVQANRKANATWLCLTAR
jgi:hypothetical protein